MITLDDLKTMPHATAWSRDSEQAALGFLLFALPADFGLVTDQIDGPCFYLRAHSRLFKILTDLIETGHTIENAAAWFDAIRRQSCDPNRAERYLIMLAAEGTTRIGVVDHAGIIRLLANSRAAAAEMQGAVR